MGLHTIGLIFLLIGAGFFLNWGYVGGNGTLDTIAGAIFGVIGFSLIMYRNPFEDTTKKFVRIANQIMDEPSVLLAPAGIDERTKRINAEARKAAREIKERARMRIRKIATEIKDITGGAGE